MQPCSVDAGLRRLNRAHIMHRLVYALCFNVGLWILDEQTRVFAT